MTETIPQSHLDLITGPVYAILTTINSQGQPENTVVWCSWDGSHVLVNTTAERRKTKNVRHNPRVALLALDPEDTGRWVDIRGMVVAVDPDTDNANINSHAKLYAGVDEFYGSVAPVERAATETRVILRIEPVSVVAYPH